MYLVNSQINLRALEPEDLDLLYKWENDTNQWIHSSTLSPYSKLTLRQYINDAIEMDIYQSKQLRLMIDTSDNTTIGSIDLYDFDVRNKRAGVGILIDEQFRNKKYGCQALHILRDYAFNYLNMNQLYAYISQSNHASIQLFEKAGYIQCGFFQNWICTDNGFEDVIVVQLINDKKG